jgi:uncharacterized protein (DUF2141 family)
VKRLAAGLVLAASVPGAAPPAELEIRVEQLRSARGAVRLCLTREADRFPDCKADPRAIRHNGRADAAGSIMLHAVPPGSYALSVIHDENGNGRLDTFAGIPREGFGFSRNPAVRFGPPRFGDARFAVANGANLQTIRVRYLL